MENWLLYASVIICLFCLQNIYVQVKRRGFVLIWYSISNTLLSLSHVIAGLTLHEDFKIENATDREKIWCGISGSVLSLSSIANAGLSLALSIELYVSLRLTNPAARQNPMVKRLNVILAIILPIISVLVSIMILSINHNRVFTNVDDGGICEISRHGDYRGILFVFRTLPEYLLIFPSCVLSVLALIPVAQKVFENRRLQNSFSITWAIDQESDSANLPTRATRGGPPPNPSIPPNAKMVLPRNVLYRMGLWCCLLIILGIPTSIVLLKSNIEYLINGIIKPDYLPDSSIAFLRKNGNTLHMVIIMALFLLCFGTGKFANEQYRKLWRKIFDILSCRLGRFNEVKTRTLKDFEMVTVHQSSSRGSSNRVSPTTTAQTAQSMQSASTSYASHQPMTIPIYPACARYYENNAKDYYSFPTDYQNRFSLTSQNQINYNNFDFDFDGESSPPDSTMDIQKPRDAKLSPQNTIKRDSLH